jgi:hypothetical protein
MGAMHVCDSAELGVACRFLISLIVVSSVVWPHQTIVQLCWLLGSGVVHPHSRCRCQHDLPPGLSTSLAPAMCAPSMACHHPWPVSCCRWPWLSHIQTSSSMLSVVHNWPTPSDRTPLTWPTARAVCRYLVPNQACASSSEEAQDV